MADPVTAKSKSADDPVESQFTNDSMKKLLRTHIERDLQRLDRHVQHSLGSLRISCKSRS
jgi:hypothetical protein